MKGNRAVVTAVVVLVLIAAGWWLFGRGGRGEAIDLIEQLPQAKKVPPDATFDVIDANLSGETKKAIAINEKPSRITWKVRVPDDAWLNVSVGMRPETWDKEGDGAYFFVVVSDGRNAEQLFTQHVHPFANKGDRKWIPVFVDLSAYAGEDMEIIFNTRTGAGGKGSNYANVLALWGEPQIVIR